MPNAACIGYSTAHGGVIALGSGNTSINNRLAARLGDYHICPETKPVLHWGGPIVQGSTTVTINGLPAARLGDMALCLGAVDTITKGSGNVIIGG